MHQILPPEGNLLWVKVSGKLTQQDYNELVPAWENAAARHGKIRILFEMLPDFAGWEPGAAWADFKFSLTHRDALERVAMVGDRKWEQWATRAAALVVQCQARYFDSPDIESAHRWLEEAAHAKLGH